MLLIVIRFDPFSCYRRGQHDSQYVKIQRANPAGDQQRNRRTNGQSQMADANGWKTTASDNLNFARILHVLLEKLPEKHRARQQIHNTKVYGN